VSVQAPFAELKCCTVPFYCSLLAKEEDILFPAMEMAGGARHPICFRINEQLSKTIDHPVALEVSLTEKKKNPWKDKAGHLGTYNLKKFEDSSGTYVSAAAEATVEPLPFHVGELFRNLAAPDAD